MNNKVCILGGGASALMCACFACGEVTIFENADSIGKKILATGNGRCNLTNINMNNHSYNKSMEKYIGKFSTESTLKFFNKIGLETYFDDEGRVYPVSNTATSVLGVLKNYIKLKKNIKINTKKCVKNVIFNKNEYKLEFQDGTEECFNKVVVATGNTTNLQIFAKMGLNVKPFLPSLCSLKTKQKNKRLAGVRISNVQVKCNSLKFIENGEVLLKEDALSGIVIFNLSSYMARCGNYKHKVYLDLLPNISKDQLLTKLMQRRKNLANVLAEDFLTGYLHKEINHYILKMAKINLENMVSEISDEQIKQICSLIKGLPFETIAPENNNQVCTGGILLNELDENLQCKKYNGLYFIGEVCNVDGVCGGYNLQWAWTSGAIVGQAL